MNSKERFYACVDYRHPDRPPCDFRAVWQIINGLMDYYGESSYEALMIRLGTDFRFIAPRYVGPELKIHEDGSVEGLWGQRSKISGSGNGTFNETVYLPYADVTDVAELDAFRFPSADWFDYSHVSEDADRFEKYIVTAGYIGASNSGDSPGYGVSPPCAPDFINGMARIRGTEQILIDIALEDPVFIELVNRKHRLSMEIYENILTAGKGKIDVLYLADDLGNQESLMISPLKFDRLFAEKYRELFALAHRHNAKAMMHCCGSVRRLIPRL
ncbi:MAG: hypothetical protein FWE82_09965, partial [Defluviitaleaceae bacterium]|nr:hypothetical protein [Defluviitaleaceae bacterium]